MLIMPRPHCWAVAPFTDLKTEAQGGDFIREESHVGTPHTTLEEWSWDRHTVQGFWRWGLFLLPAKATVS